MNNRDIIGDFINFCSEHLDTDMMKYWDSQYYPQDAHLLLDSYERYLEYGDESLTTDYSEENINE